jgi:hypothetical protein
VLDLHLRPVDLEHLLRARDRLGLVAAGHGDPPPAVEPRVELGQPAGQLVLDLEHPVACRASDIGGSRSWSCV